MLVEADMTLFVVSYLAGVLTIASPCILPILPFVLARSEQPFRRGTLPLLLGLAITFAAVASLAAVAGGWAVDANQYGRTIALAVMMLFGATLLFPGLAARLMAPITASGSRLAHWADRRHGSKGASVWSSTLLGVATGLIWAPCAGPVLGLILTGAALSGPNFETSLLLLTYAAGAATALAAGMLFGRRLLAIASPSFLWSEGARRVLGAGVVVGALVIAGGLDTGLLTRLSSATTNALEQALIATLSPARASAQDRVVPELSAPVAALLGTSHWLNTPALTATDLRGKVIVVNFWTYSCINCLRALPHVRAWAEKYQEQGLVVIGVHSPEIAFEKETDNVAKAAEALGITYPIAIDNDFGIWRAFDNQAWPALYFIGADGDIEHYVLGEGEYDDSERLIQRMLKEAGAASVAATVDARNGKGVGAAPDLANLGSGETYLGYARARGFVSVDDIVTDVASTYRPAALSLNQWEPRWLVDDRGRIRRVERGIGQDPPPLSRTRSASGAGRHRARPPGPLSHHDRRQGAGRGSWHGY